MAKRMPRKKQVAGRRVSRGLGSGSSGLGEDERPTMRKVAKGATPRRAIFRGWAVVARGSVRVFERCCGVF